VIGGAFGKPGRAHAHGQEPARDPGSAAVRSL